MSSWSKKELRTIGAADDLHISPFREEGKTYGAPTWIWSVVVDDALWVRAYHGQQELVQSRDSAEGGSNHCCGHHEGGYLCTSRRNDE